MKNLYKIGMLAVAALAFASCNKEVDTHVSKGTHVVTVKATKDFDTKTAIVEGENQASFVWTDGDEDYFHVYENGVEAKSVTMSVDDSGLATFTVEFDDTDATSFEYTAKYFKEESKNHNPLIVEDQTPSLTSFDPAADVLVAKSQTKTEPASELQFALRRVVSINKMTLKGLITGEKISSVELASTDKSFSAHYVASSDSYSGNAKKLTLDYSNLETAVVGSDGTFAVYFVSAPVEDATFSVKVTTDQNVYYRDDFTSKLTLTVDQVKRFGIKLGNYGTPISTGIEYQFVGSLEDLYSGATYLIVGGETFAMAEQKTNNRGAVAVTDEDGVITIDNTIDAYPVIIEETEGGYLIKDIKNNGYLYTSSTSANQLKNEAEADEYAVWQITFDDGVASITNVKNTSRGQMRFNPNNGSPMFAAYATNSTAGSAALALYVDESTCVAHPRIIVTPTAIDVPYAGVDAASNITFVLKDLTGPATATCDGTVVTEAEVEDNAVIYSVSANTGAAREGWIKISVGEVFAEVTINQAAAPTLDFTTVAGLNALATSTATEHAGKLTNAIVSFVSSDGKTAIIKDATGSILYYKSGHGLKQGQTFTGELTVNLTIYNSCSQITSCSATFTGAGAVVEPENVALSALVGNLSTYQNAYVQVDDLTVTGKSGKNIYVENGNNTYVVYDNSGSASCVAEDIISVKGTITHYTNSDGSVDIDELKAWAADDITITTPHPAAQRTITFTQPTGAAAEAGCSFTVSVDGSNISSGASVEEGKTVTLTANEGTNFSFTGWTVQGATVSGNTSPATFVVGTSDVTISASFRDNNQSTYEEYFSTYENTSTSNSNKSTINGDACTWSGVGASTAYWSNVSDASAYDTAVTLLKPGSADATYILSEDLTGGLTSITVCAISNNTSSGVNVYIIDVENDNAQTLVGTITTTTKKQDFTQTFTVSGITGKFKIKIANKNTQAYCCVPFVSWE